MDILETVGPRTAAILRRRVGDSQLLTWTPKTPIEVERDQVEELNRVPGSLKDCDCPLCLNRGYVWYVRETGPHAGERVAAECSCMAKRRSVKRIRESGLGNLLKRCTLDTWECREPWQRNLRDMARRYAENPKGWFYLSGRPGTGKTHLCTALCGLLLDRGLEVRYMLWRDVSVRAKALVTDDEGYQDMIRPLKRVPVLYIDDLFKTGRGQSISDGDANFAWELINARYVNDNLLTIFSTELSINQLMSIDEALGSRIYERSREQCMDLNKYGNYRILTGEA